MKHLTLLAEEAAGNPLQPNGYEIAATVLGILFVAALLAVLLLAIARLARGTRRPADSGEDAQLREEIARRTESIERRLGNIERTFQGVAE
ncbi:hypothetical protein ACSYDW_18605 [Paeniglutamicibacter sp. R2-26]|uniref:hypothetical protein n=1 Tax=Paeniglutamicibacter sp. R2-26 TaxID=3144417 RepID=UPI003EE632CC